MTRTRALAATTATAFALGALALGTTAASAAPMEGDSATTQLSAKLHQLNRSGAQGTATATVTGSTIDVALTARGLAPSSPTAPHALHIHYGETAAHECPTMGDASQRRADGTRRINVADGVPAYGPVAVALTTRESTSPADSALALDRFPTAVDGVLTYQRSGIVLTDDLAAAIAAGEGVVVVHGVDYNGNGIYDVDSAGASELDPSLPAEGTDPALCGVLRDKPGHKH